MVLAPVSPAFDHDSKDDLRDLGVNEKMQAAATNASDARTAQCTDPVFAAVLAEDTWKVSSLEDQWVAGLPKCELHIHIEGSLEPELQLAFAERNGMLPAFLARGPTWLPEDALQPWDTKEEAIAAIRQRRDNFVDLQDFLGLYNHASEVLKTRQDFYDLMTALICKCKQNNVRYSEIFFDPQSHMQRVSNDQHETILRDCVSGLYDAIQCEGKPGRPEGCAYADRKFEAQLIVCVLRDWKVTPADDRKPAGWPNTPFDGNPDAETMLTLLEKVGAVDKIVAIGMDNAEMPGAEPGLFEKVYKKAKDIGIPHATAHGGEEGMPQPFITDALTCLLCERIDHGVMCLRSDEVCKQLVDGGIHLTNCPCSNDRLQVYQNKMEGQRNVVRQKLDKGLSVGLNSDDPAYFGGYMNANLCRAREDSSLTRAELAGCMENAFRASFLSAEQKQAFLVEVAEYVKATAS
eukprot:TRINITY_DN67139_c0_g1_i1.p1 TRINITY_DN67139_c0_g1~~TRINITY_DN67139_c0_g1_i1.p1  ORF type:complete len:462 (-),score=76.50 TRINITY_DN67139_c0_g1_i1:207-1592(-)